MLVQHRVLGEYLHGGICNLILFDGLMAVSRIWKDLHSQRKMNRRINDLLNPNLSVV